MPPGIWIEIIGERCKGSCPGLFLDRDGVIIEDRNYIWDPAEVKILPGVAQMIAKARQARWSVVIVTNQSGIARGLFGWEQFAAVQKEMVRQLAAQGATIDAIAACPFHPEFTEGYDEKIARWRKPGPQMLETLAERLGIDRPRSWMVGDRLTDIEAARQAGLAGGVHVISGHHASYRETAPAADDAYFEVHTTDSVAACTEILQDAFDAPSARSRV